MFHGQPTASIPAHGMRNRLLNDGPCATSFGRGRGESVLELFRH
ncbi:MAG TPA: hypothetical protein VGI23_16770 [Steroidobacteraceae bacterium]|jgi:hypothetical protein